MMNNFYVYRHIRLDTNTPFYVGKGAGNRAHSKSGRNSYWHNIVNSVGYEVEIIMYLPENIAFAKEIEFIKLYKSLGYCEANFTVGGEGISGYKHTTEAKKKIAKAAKKNQNRPEVKIKISEKLTKMWEDKNLKIKRSKINKITANRPEVKAKKSKAAKIILNTPEIKIKISKAQIKKWDKKLKDKPFNVYIAKKISHGVYEKGKLVGVWHNRRICAIDLNIDFRHISCVLNGKRKMHKGYIFEYTNNKKDK